MPAPGPRSGGLDVGDGDEGDEPPHPNTSDVPARNITPKIDRVLLVDTARNGRTRLGRLHCLTLSLHRQGYNFLTDN